MNKNLLLRYIQGNCSSAETEQVLEWVGQGRDNELYLVRLTNLWISQNLPQEEASSEELAQMYRIIGKAAAGRKRGKGFYVSRRASWIGAACLLLAAVLWVRVALPRAQVGAAGPFDARKYEGHRLFYTDRGVKGCVVLPDSSVVLLNSDSKLWYPENFGTDIREVAISGEGYFEVRRDTLRPMIVKTQGNFHLEVLGTTFNIKSYENDDFAVTTLYSGSVNVVTTDPSGKARVNILRPNESMTVYREKQVPVVAQELSSDNPAWTQGRINFNATPVSEAVKILERWHGVRFHVDDKDVLNYRISADFEQESIVQIMDLIRTTSYVDYRIDGKDVFLKKR